MIIMESIDTDEQFLRDLREYFSSYGALYACKYCHETNFNYILVEFADYGKREGKVRTYGKTSLVLLRSGRSNHS